MKNLYKYNLTDAELKIKKEISKLKSDAGSHSPSIQTLSQLISNLDIKVDACFLSNPFATELFMKYFKRQILDADRFQDLLEFYPSQNKVIAQYFSKTIGVDAKNIFVGNGAVEIIQAIIHRFTKKRMVIIIPTFSSFYEFALDKVDIKYFTLKKSENFRLNINEYINFVKETKPDTIVIINPNNPTGSYLLQKDLTKILNELSFVENIIIDESFIHFAFEDDLYSEVTIAKMLEDNENLYIIKSMSKDFGIAGIRAGYALMNQVKVESLLKNGYLWNSNGLAEYFFRLYGTPQFVDEYKLVRMRYIQETQRFVSDLASVPNIKVYPSFANFVLIELPDTISSELVSFILLIRYGIYVRNCVDKKGLDGNYLRIASRDQKGNKLIKQALTNLFE
jgi:histidinol-phosphate/aromatic aminotransferase/cobyric acid decarboxylase-like protein